MKKMNADLKDYRQNWWDKKVILGITWNHVILAMIITMIIAYAPTDWNWVFGLR